MRYPYLVVFGLSLLASPGLAQGTVMISRGMDGSSGSGMSTLPALSADGRYLSFQSYADNLVPQDTNGVEDVFRYDLWSGQLELVSRAQDGSLGNGHSRQSGISADGRFVMFQSYAANLVPADTNGEPDIFVRDMQSGTVQRVSVSSTGEQANGGSRYGYISRDGAWVVFESVASNLVPGDTNGFKDVFLHQRSTGLTRRISLAFDGSQANEHVLACSLSADGRFVGMSSYASNLVPNDTNDEMDAFIFDAQLGLMQRVSTTTTGAQAHGLSADVNVAANGSCVAFYSLASDLVAGDSNGVGDVFVKDLQSGVMERVSVSTNGTEGNWHSYYPRITGDGRYVVFFSESTALVSNDHNYEQDGFLHDRQLGITTRVTMAPNNHEARGFSRFMAISDDSRYIAFESIAPNLELPDYNSQIDMFLHDRIGSFLSLCSADPSQASACPCANPGGLGFGCANSVAAQGAQLIATGLPAADNVHLSTSGVSGVVAIALQANQALPQPVAFGRGLLCLSGPLLRLYAMNVQAGLANAPAVGELSVRQRSAALGDPLQAAELRYYQVWYRDPTNDGCLANSSNLSNAVRVLW